MSSLQWPRQATLASQKARSACTGYIEFTATPDMLGCKDLTLILPRMQVCPQLADHLLVDHVCQSRTPQAQKLEQPGQAVVSKMPPFRILRQQRTAKASPQRGMRLQKRARRAVCLPKLFSTQRTCHRRQVVRAAGLAAQHKRMRWQKTSHGKATTLSADLLR